MKIWRLACGDLKRFAKDWRALLWLLAMPLAFAYIFGSAMRGGGQQGTWIPVIDLDRTGLSELFIDQLRQEGYFIEVGGASEQPKLKTKWPYGIVIPAGFGKALLEGKPINAILVKNNVAPDRLLEVQACLFNAIVHYTKGLILADVSHKEWTDECRASLEQALKRPQLLTVVRQTHRSLRPPPTGFYQSLPGMLAMFVMQMVVIYGGTSLVRDRAEGQMARLMASPLSVSEVYGAKVFARILLGVLQAGVLLGAGSVLFHVPLGEHPLFLAPVVLGLALFAGALSLLAGMLCQTEKQVVLVGIFSAMFFSALGGCWWPIEIVPDLFKTIAVCTPTYWAVRGLQSILYFGKSYEVLALEVPMLIAFAVGLGLLTAAAARIFGTKARAAG